MTLLTFVRALKVFILTQHNTKKLLPSENANFSSVFFNTVLADTVWLGPFLQLCQGYFIGGFSKDLLTFGGIAFLSAIFN